MSSDDFPTSDDMRSSNWRPMSRVALERLAAGVQALLEQHSAYDRWRGMVRQWQREHSDPIDLVPLPKRALTLPEKYTVLAAIRDEYGKDERIDPWEGIPASSEYVKDMEKRIAYKIVRSSTVPNPDSLTLGFPEGDEPYLRLHLAAVEADLKSRVALNADKPRASKGADLPAKPTVQPSVNARMLETIQQNPDAMGWNSPRWAKHLKCAKSSIVETQTWKTLESARLRAKAERMEDRRRRPKASDHQRD